MEHYWHLAGRGQGCCQTCYNSQNCVPENKIISPIMSMVLRLKNPELEKTWGQGTELEKHWAVGIYFRSCTKGITAGWAQNGPVLFNGSLSCFSETSDQNYKLRCLGRGENFNLWLHPKVLHPTLLKTKGPGHNQNLNTRMLSEAKVPLSRNISVDSSLP